MEKQLESFSSEIYKFTKINKNLLKSLDEGYLWLSKPQDFNDPFDCYEKLISIDVNDDLIKKSIDSSGKKMNKEQKRLLIEKIKRNKKEFGTIMQDSILELYSNIGVCCFTHNNYTDILMWSHYGNNHKGVCLKFDIALAMESFQQTLKVNYTSEFKAVDYDYNSAKSLNHFVTTKSKAWEYENEIRKVRLLSQNPSQEFMFPSKSLTEISFGCETTENDADTVYKIIQKKYPHVKIQHMKREESRFELRPIEGYLY